MTDNSTDRDHGPSTHAPRFSVIIPTYGRAAFLREAVDSVLNQTFDDFELIVIDDASPDPIILPSDPRIRLLRHAENQGSAAARNTGIRSARGTYLCFLDDDDWYLPNRLQTVTDHLTPGIVTICWDDLSDGRAGKHRVIDVHDAAQVLSDICPHLACTTIAKQDAEPFDETFRSCQDVEWWVRTSQTLPVRTIAVVGTMRREHDGERLGYGSHQRALDGVRLIEKHATFFEQSPTAASFRWKRAGLSATQRGLATRALLHSLRLAPNIKTLGHLLLRLVLGPGLAARVHAIHH